MKRPAKLPEALRYMQPFVNALSKLPGNALNEDVDASALEAALRERLRALDEGAAESALRKDLQLLDTWLGNIAMPNHPAYWVLGYLSSPEITSHLLHPPEPLKGPVMTFEAPKGWTMKAIPFRLDLKKGKLLGTIGVVDEQSFENLGGKREHMGVALSRGLKACDVCFGECVGKKYISVDTAPVFFKQVKYALRIPGGYVSIWLGAKMGADFDESELEGKFHTLRLTWAPAGGATDR